MVPVIVTADVALLPTLAPLLPAVRLSVPSPTDRVTVSVPGGPPSASLTDSPVPFSDRVTAGLAWYWVGVMVATGGAVAAVMLIVAVSNDDRSPPPVAPLSWIVSVSVALADGASVLSM